MSPWLDIAFFLAIGLLVVDLVLLLTVVYVLGRQYSFFRPWRYLLVGLMGYTGIMILSDAWWYFGEFPFMPRFYALRLIISRLSYTLVILVFTTTWVRSIQGASNGRLS